VDGFRKVIHLVLMIFVFVVMLAALGSGADAVKIKDGTVLLLNPSGVLVHELSSGELDLELLRMNDDPPPETLVRDVVRALRHAAEDDRIAAVLVDIDGLGGGGFTKLQDIAAAMRAFRESGKPMVSYSRWYGQNGYLLAAQADEVFVHDYGGVDIRGMGRWRLYYAEMFRKLGIDPHVFRIGEYKSFVEPYFRDDMSDEDRQSAEQWLGALWGEYQREVTQGRELASDALDQYAAGLTQALEDAGGDLARVNLEAGLVDAIHNEETFKAYMAERFGDSEDGEYNKVGFADYLTVADRENPPSSDDENKVGVVVVSGSIIDGSAGPGAAAGDSIAKLVRHAAEEDSIKALVLQVDSPGGSAFASEVISGAVATVSEAGKPVVVSMSSVAASGGYYVAAEADEIWAYSGTITGSIGVGAVLFTAPKLLERIGFTEDGLGTTPLSEQGRIGADMDEGLRRQVDAQIGRVYERFVGHVSQGRGMTFEEVDGIGRGRVWIGSDAASINLVDQIGTLKDAAESAAGLAGLEEGNYSVERIKRKRPFFTGLSEFFQLRLARLRQRLGMGSEPDRFMDAVQQAREILNAELDQLAQLNDPRGFYYHCGTCAAY
jgi:protease-4